MKPETRYMVIWGDPDEETIPYGWDSDCKGALTGAWAGNPAVVFPTRRAAKRAIQVSTAFARLRKAQGKAHNSDFISDRKCVRIVPVVMAVEEENQ